MDLDDFLQPVNDTGSVSGKYPGNSLGFHVDIYSQGKNFPDISGYQIAIVGVPEERGSVGNSGCGLAPDEIRKKLYKLACGNYTPKICDLGNIRNGKDLKDTYAAVAVVCGELLKNGIIPVLLGGSQDITYAQYLSYKAMKQTVNIVGVDAFFDLGISGQKQFTSKNYLGKIILHQPNFLFNFSNIGFQTHFVGQDSIRLMEKLFFDACRLGQVRKNIEEVEPVVRNADILSFDVSSIRASDAPGNKNASPNGFFGEEACQIARYAGLSEKLTSAGFYETNPKVDVDSRTSYLVAQMVWYFIDGFYSRKKDYPLSSKGAFKKYRVAIQNNEHEIIFYKSRKSERWWMQVPYPDNKAQYERHHLVPCSYSDYEMACREEIPERWWLAFQKLTS